MTGSDAAEALRRLLAEERAALLSGDLAALAGLIAAKEAALESLSASGVPSDTAALERLRDQAAQNQTLLDAALRGVRSVQERLEMARSGGPPLASYDARGRATTLPTGQSSVLRRA
ncbi:MAG: hypothetical protein N2Z62_08600 [Rhodobacteraceae bacterium]|nr:hypothetical protein [Paracoccaceae bacterium]